METDDLLKHADDLLQIALYKCDTPEEAQDLAQNVLLTALLAIKSGKKIDNPKSWLTTVLNRKYYDHLREKYRKPVTYYGMFEDVSWRTELEDGEGDGPPGPGMEPEGGGHPSQGLAQGGGGADEERLRQLLAHQTRIYREVIVRHYLKGQSVKEIAAALTIPENTVKSRLRLGRDQLRKEFYVEKYAQQSYEPESLFISSSGRCGLDGEPFSLVGDDKIAMNLLILAYDNPVTIPELASAIGISTTYIEPIVDKLVRGELMKQVADKVYTDFIIYTEEDRLTNLELEKEMAGKLCPAIWKVVEEGLGELREKPYYQDQNPHQAVKLESYFVLRTIYQSALKVRDEVAGGQQPFAEYPDRPNDGKWYAMGNRYPADYDYAKCPYAAYGVSGEAGGELRDLPGAKRVGLWDYDTDDIILGRTHRNYRGGGMSGREEMTKLLYAVYGGNGDMMGALSQKTLKWMDSYIEMDYFERNEGGELVINVPVLSQEERSDFYGLSGKYDQRLSEQFHGEYLRLMQKPVILPKHLKSVPNWQRYLTSCCNFPCALIYEAREKGLFLKGYDRPAPAVMLWMEKD